MSGAPRWYEPRAETDRAQLLSWLRSAQADGPGSPGDGRCDMAALLWADDPVNEWAQWNDGDRVPAGYVLWSSVESRVMYVGLPAAAVQWSAYMAETRVVESLCGRVADLELALRDLVAESLDGDNRHPQPALQRAIATLRRRT